MKNNFCVSKEVDLITVITVVYNAVEVIEDTLLSVLGQTYRNIEYIIVEGGSTDGTIDIINKYYGRITHVISEPDRGVYDAMNKGIRLSSGKWLNFMNAGDTFYNEKVVEAIFSAKAYSHDVKVLYGDVEMRLASGNNLIKRIPNLEKDRIPFSLNHQSTFIEGNWMRAKGYDISYKIASDANFFNETLRMGYIFLYVPVIIASYEASEGISATNHFLLHHEFCKIRGERKLSRYRFRGLVKAVLNTFISSLPHSCTNKIQYLYLKYRLNK